MNNRPQEAQTNIVTRAQDFPVRVWGFLTNAHPSVTEIGEQRRAQLLAILSLILTISFIWALQSVSGSPLIFYIMLSITLVAYIFSRTKYYRIGAYFFSFGITSQAFTSLYFGTANSIDASISAILPIAFILASALLSQRGFLILAITSVIATARLASFADPKYFDDPSLILGKTIGITFSTAAVLLGVNAFRAGIERARLKEAQVINQLEELTIDLEQRVNDRTMELEKAHGQTSHRAAQLQTIVGLSEAVAELHDLNQLLPAVTNLISDRFNFYHVGIFLVDSNKEFVNLQAANSEGGKQMLKRQHKLKLGTGVVGYAAQIGQARIALDVGTDAVFFDNPDLPNTRSEVALPMKSRGEVIGILDVQSTEAGAFSTDDLEVLSTLANQVSIAFENIRLLTETRAALTQVEEVYGEFTRAEWSRAITNAEQSGFRYHSGRIEILENELQSPEVKSATESGNTVTNQAEGSSEKRTAVAIPVKLRGEVIGILHIESNSSKDWQEDDISLVESVAQRAAFAMENARLFQDARRRASKEQLISEATSKISSAFNIENILQTTAEELERVLGGSEVLIQFQDKEQQS